MQTHIKNICCFGAYYFGWSAMAGMVNGNSCKEVTVDTYEVCKDAHAIAILTEWEEFKTYDWKKIYDEMKKPAFMFDGRRILHRKGLEMIGFRVYRIGEANL